MQTYANLIVLMCSKFSKLNHQDSTTARAAGHASANNFVKEMTQATEELVTELTEKHTKQVEALIKSNKEAMEKLTAAILAYKSGNPVTTATNSNSSSSKAATKRVAKATTCPQCNCVHPNCMHDQCWELPANAAKCLAGWTGLDVSKEHLKVQGAFGNVRVAAIYSKYSKLHNLHLPRYCKLLGPTGI